MLFENIFFQPSKRTDNVNRNSVAASFINRIADSPHNPGILSYCRIVLFF